MTNLTELQALGQKFDAGTPPPRCAVCKQEICSHTDLEFAGLSPVDEDE